MHHIVPIPSGADQEYRDWQEAHRERSDACNEAALLAVNRLMRFYKYGLRYPLLQPFRLIDILPPRWLNAEGAEIQTGLQFKSAKWKAPAYLENTLQPEEDRRLAYFLENDLHPSLAEEILLDALGAAEEKHHRRGVIEAAICCEIAVKDVLGWDFLDETEQSRVPVAELLDRVFRDRFGESFKDTFPERHRDVDLLFRARNQAAHRGNAVFRDDRGERQAVTRHMIMSWLISVQHLLEWLRRFEQTVESASGQGGAAAPLDSGREPRSEE